MYPISPIVVPCIIRALPKGLKLDFIPLVDDGFGLAGNLDAIDWIVSGSMERNGPFIMPTATLR